MSRQYSELAHSWFLPPNDYLVFAVAVGAHELVNILRVGQITHLASGVDPVKRLAGQGIPEANATVGSASARAHHAVLVRGPSDSLDCRLVLTKPGMRLRVIVTRPDEQLVIVAATSKLLLVRGPFEAADLLLVAIEPCEVVVLLTPVPVQYALIAAARAEHARLPSDASDSAFVSEHTSDFCLSVDVPFLQLTSRGAHGQIVAVNGPAD